MSRQMRNLMLAMALASAGALWLMPGFGAAQQAQQPQQAQQAQPSLPTAGTVRYTLIEVGGKPLPALVEQEVRCREEVTDGALTLRDDGRWLLETTTREVCGDRTEEDRDRDDGTYSSEGSTLRFLDDEGRVPSDRGWGVGTDIDLDDLVSGTLAGDGRLNIRLADGRTTLVFRR